MFRLIGCNSRKYLDVGISLGPLLVTMKLTLTGLISSLTTLDMNMQTDTESQLLDVSTTLRLAITC
jgi:hypothetical protein